LNTWPTFTDFVSDAVEHVRERLADDDDDNDDNDDDDDEDDRDESARDPVQVQKKDCGGQSCWHGPQI
jgi:hypothetical protein